MQSLQVRRVLELMEEHGGPNAYRYIKFSIPLCKILGYHYT